MGGNIFPHMEHDAYLFIIGYEKPPAQMTESDIEAVTSELTQQEPPPYAGIKPVLYLPTKK